MKKALFILAILLLQASAFAQQASIDDFRIEYRTANKDSSSCAALYKKASKITSSDNLVNGYKGAITMMYAGFIKDKAEKLKLVKAGRDILEAAIAKDKENPELILLRFSIQSNAPKILGYNKELESDKKLLLQKYGSIENKEIKTSIRSLLMQSKLVTAAEKEKLK
jgi:hypothetical protein